MDTHQDEYRFAPELISERYNALTKRVAEISEGKDVKLVAVTKTVPVEAINYAIDNLGVTAIGENRVQELLSKYDSLSSPKDGKLEIHLIGSLQTNKVKYIIDKVDIIESVDSLKLAAEIDKQAKKHSLTMDILVEVNIGSEPQKGGVLPEELYGFIDALDEFSSIRVRGLMTVAPKCENKEDYIAYFSKTCEFFNAIRAKKSVDNNESKFDILSMGMSDSFEEAIACGSNQIRPGSVIFGKRSYPEQTK